MACWVVGVDESDGSGARRDSVAKVRKIDVPAVVVEEGIRNEADIADLGEEVEEGVAWPGDEDFVIGIAKQTEEEAVGLAGAGGKDDLIGLERGSVAGVIGTDRFPGEEQAARVGFVVQDGGFGEGCEDCGFVVLNAAEGGI